jgi:hypothetical protein
MVVAAQLLLEGVSNYTGNCIVTIMAGAKGPCCYAQLASFNLSISMKSKRWSSRGLCIYLHIFEANAGTKAGPESLHHSLFGGETRGKFCGSVWSRASIADLSFEKTPFYQ